MAELIDVLDESGLRTGEILSRAEIHRQGKRHRAVHLYLFNSRYELLLQRRSMTVDHAPGVYGISVTGHINAGEYSSQTVRREVEEELGLDASQLEFHFLFSYYQEAILHKSYLDYQFNDLYVARAEIDPAQINFDRNEVAEVKFAPFAEFQQMLADETSIFALTYGDACRDLLYFLRSF